MANYDTSAWKKGDIPGQGQEISTLEKISDFLSTIGKTCSDFIQNTKNDINNITK